MKLADFESVTSTLKLQVDDMLLERATLGQNNGSGQPSSIWTEALTMFKYLMSLPAEELRNIRFHTGLLGGTPWRYWHPYPVPDPEEEVTQLGWMETVEGLPERYRFGEPPAPGIPFPLGVEYKGLVINPSIIRFQHCVSNLFRVGALESILRGDQKSLIVEIGGGYGGLAHSLGGILEDQATYTLIDFPEMFLVQGSYLAVNNPGKSMYVYDSRTFTPEFVREGIHDYDFVLVPNFALSKLKALSEIGVMINMASFQEMTEQQVLEYLDFGAQRITEYLYSDNMDNHPYNSGLSCVTTLVDRWFDLYPNPDYYEQLFGDTNLKWSRRYKQYLGIPKTSGRKFESEIQLTHWNYHPETEHEIGSSPWGFS